MFGWFQRPTRELEFEHAMDLLYGGYGVLELAWVCGDYRHFLGSRYGLVR